MTTGATTTAVTEETPDGSEGSTGSTTGSVGVPADVACGSLSNVTTTEALLTEDSDRDLLEIGVGPAGTWLIVACGTGGAIYDSGSTNRPLDVYVVDVEGDGIDELLAGTTFGAGPFAGDLIRYDGTAFVASGYDIVVSPGDESGRSFGCVDSDGDGQRELIGLDYNLSTQDGLVRWARFRFDGQPITPAVGIFDLNTEGPLVATLRSGTCGDAVIVPAN